MWTEWDFIGVFGNEGGRALGKNAFSFEGGYLGVKLAVEQAAGDRQ